MDNIRFNQLLDLARGGDECAVAELFQVFGFRFGTDDPAKFQQSEEPSC